MIEFKSEHAILYLIIYLHKMILNSNGIRQCMFEGNCKLINFNMKLVVNNTIVVVRIALIKIYLVFNVIVSPKV